MVKELNFDHRKTVNSRGITATKYFRDRDTVDSIRQKVIKYVADGGASARSMVHYAIKNGKLKCLKKNVIFCAYCKCRATVYDHRDYNRPLDVTPCCYSCNVRLGMAISKKKVHAKASAIVRREKLKWDGSTKV